MINDKIFFQNSSKKGEKVKLRSKIGILTILLLTILATGCSKKEVEFNKPADYWYDKFLYKISQLNLDDADDIFSSLSSEHPNSSYTKKALLILANAHMTVDEYEIANGFLDEYIKRFGDAKEIEYARYLKIKVNYMSFKYQYRNQKLLDDTIRESSEFFDRYPNSRYAPLVSTILTNMKLAREGLNNQIITLYDKLEKPLGVEKYQEKLDKDLHDINQKEVEIGYIRRIFE